jgi:hypothetical protein
MKRLRLGIVAIFVGVRFLVPSLAIAALTPENFRTN